MQQVVQLSKDEYDRLLERITQLEDRVSKLHPWRDTKAVRPQCDKAIHGAEDK